MALSETAQLIVSLRLQDQLTGGLTAAKGELAGLETQAASTSSKIGSSFKNMGTAITAGVAAFAGFKVAEFLGGAVEAAREEDASIARLTASLKANATAWDGNVQAVEAHIAANTAAAFSDDELRQSLGSLVAATHDVTQAFEDQQTAIDLARFSGKSLAEATQTIIAVEAGRFRGLAQLGISIKGVTTSEEALAKIRDVVAGQSSAFLETDAGKAARLKVSIDELSESFGHLASGPVADASVALAGFFDTLSGVAAQKFQAQGQAIAENAADFVKKATVAQLEAARTATAEAIDRLNAQLQASASVPVLGQLANPEQAAAIAQLARTLDILDTALGNVGVDLGSGAESARGAAAALAELDHSGSEASVSFKSFTDDTKDTGAGLDNVDRAARAVTDSLNAIPKSIAVDIVFRVAAPSGFKNAQDAFESGLGGGTGGGPGGLSGGDLFIQNQTRDEKDRADAAAARAAASVKATQDRARAQDEAARKSKQAADELAASYREKVSNAFDKAKRTSDSLFDSLHDRHLKAIHDAETLAQKQHDAAVDQINDALKVAKAQDALAVNQAQRALDAQTQAQQIRDLHEAADDAARALQKTPNDVGAQRAARNANEALANFSAQQNIAALQAVQAAKDKAAEDAAQKARDQADADLEAAKLKASADTAFANKADAKKKQDFDLALDALKKKDVADPTKFLVDVKALQAKFGIFADERGFTHIGDVVADAIKNTKPPDVHITLSVPRGAIQLNGRDINNAATVGISPTQSQSTRSGNARPRGN